jgi:hypothetical protein
MLLNFWFLNNWLSVKDILNSTPVVLLGEIHRIHMIYGLNFYQNLVCFNVTRTGFPFSICITILLLHCISKPFCACNWLQEGGGCLADTFR